MSFSLCFKGVIVKKKINHNQQKQKNAQTTGQFPEEEKEK